jgi:hypothetical protein
VGTEQLKANRHKTLQEVFRFLNVDESFRSPHHDAIYHVSKPRGAFWRTVERSRFARSIRPYVPRSIVYWAARRGPEPRTAEPPSLDGRLREALRDYLREDVERLRSQVGRDFAEWSI